VTIIIDDGRPLTRAFARRAKGKARVIRLYLRFQRDGRIDEVGSMSVRATQRAMLLCLLVLGTLVGLAAWPMFALAGDWPQILGPTRNGRAQGEALLTTWPGGAPATVWQMPVGSGLAGVAVRDGRLVLFHRQGGELIVEGLEAATGKRQWRATIATRYVSSISPDDGPRSVPLIHGDRVFVLGPAGELACLSFDSGKRLWLRNILREFGAPEGYFGAGSTPIVEDGKLLVNVGGRGAGLVALSPADGKTLWKATDEQASYSSPTAATIDGSRHVVFVTRLNVVSVDPKDGAVRFRFPFGARGPTVNAANPLVLGDHVFVSASYGVGAQLAKIGPREATTVWESDDVMSSQYTTCVEHEGILYGIDGRQDVGSARLRAIDPHAGKVLWTEDDFATGNLILVGDKLLIMRSDGQLILAEASPKEFRKLAQAKLFDTTTQALAALSNGLLYARDTGQLKCVSVGARKR
jgi:outer membrane protein assembly factor BamB